MESLDARVRWQWIIRGVLLAAGVGLAGVVVDRFVYAIGLWIPVGAFGVVAVGYVPYSVARYRAWRYEIQSDALALTHGVLTRVRTAVPYVRVQHVDIKRGPVERSLGLARVVVYTAGSRGADVTIPGLSAERAEQIHAELRDLAIESEEDAV